MRAIIVIGVSCLMLIAIGCGKEADTIKFVFPEEFEGLVLVSEDSANGRDFSKGGPEISLSVPIGGRLTLRSLGPFNHWHKTEAIYSSGKILPFSGKSNGLFELPFVANRGIYYFVGNKEDYEAISRTSDFDKLPLGKKIELQR